MAAVPTGCFVSCLWFSYRCWRISSCNPPFDGRSRVFYTKRDSPSAFLGGEQGPLSARRCQPCPLPAPHASCVEGPKVFTLPLEERAECRPEHVYSLHAVMVSRSRGTGPLAARSPGLCCPSSGAPWRCLAVWDFCGLATL